MSDKPVWLITGCSTGIGRAIAEAALERGDRVAVTARNPAAIADIVGAHGDRAIGLALDVANPAQVKAAVAAAEQAFGRIDILVNNAGYGYLAAIEEGEDSEVRALFDTNYFGAIAMAKAVLPGMRARRLGHIINISSMTGLVSNPGAGYYSASKFAMEAMTECLAKELAPFGIKSSAVEPGAFRTKWAGGSMKQTSTPLEAYADTVGARRNFIKGMDGKQAGDPVKCAHAVLRIALSPDAPVHLLLGQDVLGAFKQKLADLQKNVADWEAVTLDVNLPDA
jgi:NAD(P)-dependent dehydrogenase (short-subunit alcohol dehydrogenase family)